MARFLLIHGSCHGAWCWRDVVPLLRAGGHQATAIDLPSHGDDPTPIAEVTLDTYADAILAHLDQPTVLVGHSMAGYPITRAADRDPRNIARLVYLCAYVPRDGQSLADMRRAGPRQPLREAIEVAEDGQSFRFRPGMVAEKLYHDCPDEAVAFALPRLGPQPVRPQATPITLGTGITQVERHYVLCADDRAIPPEYQHTMTEGWPEGHVTTLPTSHSPFFAAPKALADRLAKIAG